MEHFPPGFRFYPTEEELISFYLHNKLDSQKPEVDRVIPSIDIYFFEPSQLPEKASKLFDKDSEQWFFFMPQQEREARGGRPNRTTATGYWKATGSPSYVYSSSNKVIGVKKTMVFYEGKAPNGRKTQWKMNEYKAIKQVDNNLNANVSPSTSTIPKLRHEISVCRVYVTSGCARAFDRRPPGTTCTTTTTTLNDNSASHNDNIISTTFDHNIIQVEVGQGSGTTHQHAETSMNVPTTILLEEKSSSVDDSSNSGGDDTCTHQTTSTMEACINNHDFEMTESLDSLIDWDPSNLLGYNFDY